MIDNREAIISDLKACKTAFDQAGIPWCIADGVVLGYARYNDVMPWDTDLDVQVMVELSDDDWLRLHGALHDNGFIFPSAKIDFFYCCREISFNMMLFHKKGDYYEAIPGPAAPGLKYIEKAVWYDEPQIVDFLGDKYPMPNNIEDYLNCRYGEDWMTNIIKDHDEFFVYKRGGITPRSWQWGRCGKTGTLWPRIIEINDDTEKLCGGD